MSRHCTSGSPASIITENCRVNTARLLAAGFFPVLPGFLAAGSARAFAWLIRVTRICSRRSAATAPSIVSAIRSPLTVCPLRVRPEYANVGMIRSLRQPRRPTVRARPAVT
jgi:hypothetical protein